MEVIKVKIDDLILDPNNARTHDEKNINSIKGSLTKFGQQHPIIIDKNNMVLAGNGRVGAMKALDWSEVDCVVSDLDTITEKTAFALADNRTAELATWDADILSDTLNALKMDEFDLDSIGFELDDLGNFISEGSQDDAGEYTAKIEAPIYEITGAKPAINELFDLEKSSALLKKIDKSNVPDEVKIFLTQAAGRHTVFNYENIAEYYAHADKDVQELMEDSALVVIDFDKAIEDGFVKLVSEMENEFLNQKEVKDE